MLIVARNAREAGVCAHQEGLTASAWRFVADRTRLSGVGPGGRVITYGGWSERRDFFALNAAINDAQHRGAEVVRR